MNKLPLHAQIAAVTVLEELAKAAKEELKRQFRELHGRKTSLPITEDGTPDGPRIGDISIPDPDPAVSVNLDYANAWVVDTFGPDAIVTVEAFALSPQAKLSVEAWARKAHKAGVELPPGITVTPGSTTPRFTRVKGVDWSPIVSAWVAGGLLDLPGVLATPALPEGGSDNE